ncbi:MAG: GH92 family glycosyl hydrolase, partial [Ginsengibacter sp.]
MRIIFLSVFFLSAFTASAQNEAATNDPVDYVNPLMGTDSKPSMSNGNTYPAIALPWGMNLWTPQTGRMGDGWAYQYAADRINGFKQTHQPSPWMNDYGAFAIMPITGKIRFEEKDRQSWFSHKAEISKPYYYSVYLADADVTTEITPTERAASFRFTFPEADSSSVIIDALDKGSYIKIIPSENKVIGYTTRNSGGVTKDFKNYFVIIFNKPFDYSYSFRDSTITKDLEQKCNHAGAIIGFKNTRKGEIISAKIASSYISFDQAAINLKEIGNDNFETTKSKAKQAWNNVLGKVKVSGGTVDQMRTFYSCLYRMVFFPLKFYEKNAAGKIVHYSPYTGKTEDGYMFGGTGFWDTFRALYPFLNLVYPSIVKEMQQGLVNDYKEGGFLPEWSAPGYRDVMVGNNSASIVSEAFLKGGRGYDIETLYEALKHGANNEGPEGTGRTGVKYYNDLGYVPYNVKINENAARTLEYAYDDYCIYQLGKALGKPESEIAIYKKRAMNYRNLFDSSHLLMRGKNEDGTFQSPFNPFKWGDAFTEGNSWHYSWSVFQDINGLIKLMGGKEKFVAMLDSVFKMPPTFDDSYYGGVIHEIREMQIADMGQYAHGNQPIQHMIYLYDYAGEPWKTQYWARETMSKLYKATPDGYCGDEDNGQTSAWYVFSALGFYPVTPASTQYAAGAPLFKHAEINFENGKTLSINAPNNNKDTRFVKSVTYNGKPYTKNYFHHFDLQKGGTINVEMSTEPNKERGTHNSDAPFSLSASHGDWNNAFSAKDISRDTISKGGYTLVFINKDAAFSNDVKQHMINTFFSVYPKEVKAYNRNSLKKVIIIIDPEYDGVAATSGSIVRVNPEWMHKHPEDLDVVTHEVMHIVQSYPG